MAGIGFLSPRIQKELLVRNRWPWHLAFWLGYILFRFWVYYITLAYYPRIFLEYMLISEIFFATVTYLTISLYKKLAATGKYGAYLFAGVALWLLFLYGRTAFQFNYLRQEPGFKGNRFADMFLNNIAVVLVCFLFITACKYFKDGYIAQQFEAERKEQQLLAEVNNLKSQIAPHFLFNTLNNLYGLAVEKSDKLPGLMLRLSDLLRHSLYETQKSWVPIGEELKILESYVQLERVRLEDDLDLQIENSVPENAPQQIAPLLLIVFVENAFKHSKLVQTGAVAISIHTKLDGDWFEMMIRNNFNSTQKISANGIGLMNVKRRLDVLYPGGRHELDIKKEDIFYTVKLRLQLKPVN
jgi:two-component system sensor histidine kinase LytS